MKLVTFANYFLQFYYTRMDLKKLKLKYHVRYKLYYVVVILKSQSLQIHHS